MSPVTDGRAVSARPEPVRAAETVFLSKPVSVEQLCAWNVVNRVVEDAGLDQAAGELAMRSGMRAADLKDMLYAYPTRGSDVPYMP